MSDSSYKSEVGNLSDGGDFLTLVRLRAIKLPNVTNVKNTEYFIKKLQVKIQYLSLVNITVNNFLHLENDFNKFYC